MPNENLQPPQPNMNPDEAAASLAFATMLSEQMMPKSPQEPSQTLQNAPGQEETLDLEETPAQPNNEAMMPEKGKMPKEHTANMQEMMIEVKNELSEIKKLIKTDEKSEIENLKIQIKQALEEDGE